MTYMISSEGVSLTINGMKSDLNLEFIDELAWQLAYSIHKETFKMANIQQDLQ